MASVTSLQARKHKDLAQLARQHGISGWHSMRKSQLIEALSSSRPSLARRPSTRVKIERPTATQRRVRAALAERDRYKDLSTTATDPVTDRLILMVRDAFWLHATWHITAHAVERARAALAENWHTARPILRLFRIPAAGIKETQPAEVVVRDIEIHGAVNGWFIDVTEPPMTFRAEIGYLSRSRDFRAVARSNVVTTPTNATTATETAYWEITEDPERILALSGGFAAGHACDELREYLEQRLLRPIGRNAANAPTMERTREPTGKVSFSVDAEMIVFGTAAADARVTMDGEPIAVNPDGSFSVRVELPDRRQVLPIVATSRNGREIRTVVLAIERNTKTLEPRMRDRG